MGFFKKIFKGIGKVFKKIGRGIKKAFKSFGKFMNKIGFVGQMAMMFLFPGGIGNFLLKGLGKLGTTLATVSGNGMFATAVQGIGKILTGTQKFITAAKAGFSSITNGIMEFGKTAINKIPGIKPFENAAENFFFTPEGGGLTAWQKTKDGFSEVSTLFKGLRDGKVELSREFKDIKELSNKVGITVEDLKELNPNLDLEGAIEAGTDINVNLTEFYKSGKLPAQTTQKALLEQNKDWQTGAWKMSGPRDSGGLGYGMEDLGTETGTGTNIFSPGGEWKMQGDGSTLLGGAEDISEDIQNTYLKEIGKIENEEQGFISRMIERGGEELFGDEGRYNPDKPFSTATQMYKDAQMIASEVEGYKDVEDPHYARYPDVLGGASIGTGDDPTALMANRFGNPAGTNMLSIYGYTPYRTTRTA